MKNETRFIDKLACHLANEIRKVTENSKFKSPAGGGAEKNIP
jgi:hypothetical protein